MNGEIGFQAFVLVVAIFVLIRTILKLPKKFAIGFFIFYILSIVTILVMSIYYTQTLINLLEFLQVVNLTEYAD